MAKLSKTREQLIEMFVKSLEQDIIPWHQPWKSMHQCNGLTGYRYQGINAMLLSYISQIKKYDDPRWLTFNQIKKSGFHLKRGSTGVPVEYWMFYDQTNKRYLKIEDGQNLIKDGADLDLKIICKTTTVFNGTLVEGLPPYIEQKTQATNQELSQTLETLIKNMDVKVMTSNSTDACYQPQADVVHVPKEGLFKDYSHYAFALLHELAHATAHESRLNRPLRFYVEDPESYAKEELRAEIASTFLAEYFPIDVTDDHDKNHVAYIQSWISILKNEPEELFKAIKDADKIVDYMVEQAEIQKELESVEVVEKEEELVQEL